MLYQRYPLPVTLRPGDRVEIDDAGAYTASYASVAFNGFPPLPTYFVGTAAAGGGRGREIVEPLAPGLTRNWRLSEVICDVRTEFQDLVIGRTEQGVALFSDGERQSTEFSQLVYHEALLVPALLLADRIERVLVIGSGEGVVSQLAVVRRGDTCRSRRHRSRSGSAVRRASALRLHSGRITQGGKGTRSDHRALLRRLGLCGAIHQRHTTSW